MYWLTAVTRTAGGVTRVLKVSNLCICQRYLAAGACARCDGHIGERVQAQSFRGGCGFCFCHGTFKTWMRFEQGDFDAVDNG